MTARSYDTSFQYGDPQPGAIGQTSMGVYAVVTRDGVRAWAWGPSRRAAARRARRAWRRYVASHSAEPVA